MSECEEKPQVVRGQKIVCSAWTCNNLDTRWLSENPD